MWPDRDARCFTCRHAIGGAGLDALTCTLIHADCPGLCSAYEREAGADIPERLLTETPALTISRGKRTTPFRQTREEKRDIRELRSR
jgi:hypothetical protein